MQQYQALNTYQKTRVETADNLRLVTMCYEAAIEDLRTAKRLQESQAIEATYDKIRHAQDIITELLVGLDYERGGSISQNLSRLYNFMLRQLIGVNSRKDTSTYDHLIRLLFELKGAWEEIREQGAAAAPQPMSNLMVQQSRRISA
jgi:flagellar secretion chaperone FliS